MSYSLWRVDHQEIDLVTEAIKSGLKGNFTKKFEKEFAKSFGIEYAIALNSGTSALHASLMALNIGVGDEVIVPPMTFIATAFAPIYVGATPVFADIEEDSFNISPEDIKNKITDKTKAVIAVSLYGLPPKLDEIKKICEDNDLFLIEDNAECVLGKCEGKLAGLYGDLSIFSFQRSKHLTTGDGGMITTNNKSYEKKIRCLREYGWDHKRNAKI